MTTPSDVKANYLDALWRFFASLKLTVIVLFSLAVMAGIGTFLPQNKSPEEYFQAFGPFWYRILSDLDMFDLYHAWWFRLLIMMLVINIIICSVDRLRLTWKIIFPKSRHIDPEKFIHRPSRLAFQLNAPSKRLRDPVERLTKQALGSYTSIPVDKGFALTADQGRWTRLGVYMVHLSVIVLLVGGLIGSIWGFEGFVNLPEQETIQAIALRDSNQRIALPFSLRCDDARVQVYDNGAPKEWRIWLTILENGRTVVQKDIIVNDPLRYKGINIFLSSFGKLREPDRKRSAAFNPHEPIHLTFQSRESGMVYNKDVHLNEVVQLPEGQGVIKITGFEENGIFKGVDIGPVLKAQLTPAQGERHTISIALMAPKFDAMRGGAMIISAQAALTDNSTNNPPEADIRYYAGLQITKDPGVGIVYTGFILMIVGCFVCFFTSHRQVVIMVTAKGDKSDIIISGSANKNKLGLQTKLERLAERLKEV